MKKTTFKQPQLDSEMDYAVFLSQEKHIDNLNKIGKRRIKRKNAKKQVYWGKNAEKVKLSKKEFEEKIEFCKTNYKKSEGTKTMKRDWPAGSYRLEGGNFKAQLFVRDEKGKLFWYYVNAKSENTNEKDEAVGSKAIKLANKYSKMTTDKALVTIYGKVPAEFKFCTPKQFYYLNRDYSFRIQPHMNCIDACSQYPSGFLKSMPTAKDAKIVSGTAKPTEEYPFAFYLKSGHLAIYKELDTHEWLNSEFKDWLFQDEKKDLKNLLPEQDITVLMKKAELNPLAKFFEENYKIKETFEHDTDEYKSAKLVMNSLIGMFHQKDYIYSKSNWQLAHLSAVAIARGNQKILDKAKEIGQENVAMIVVDSIIYKGKSKFGEEVKRLGEMHQECYDCDYRQIKISTYAFFKDGVCVKFKHGSTNDDGFGNQIKAPKSLTEMDQYRRI